jgi:peptide/nickel transport system ATP-binding protein
MAQSAASFNPARKGVISAGPAAVSTEKRMEAREDAIILSPANPDEIGFRYPPKLLLGDAATLAMTAIMSCRPDLIIFDEPTAALDVATQDRGFFWPRSAISGWLTRLRSISHADLAVVAQMADQVLLKGEEVGVRRPGNAEQPGRNTQSL